jgi:RNA polymerase primary sigma factor
MPTFSTTTIDSEAPGYIEAMRSRPLLTLDEERAIGWRIYAGRAAERKRALDRDDADLRAIADGQAAQHEMIEANLRLAASEAAKCIGRGLEYWDLVQMANIGLMRAAAKFDVAKGNKFSTYATWWIRQALMRALDDLGREIRLPVHAADKIKQLARIRAQLTAALERQPTMQELADAAGLEVEKVAHLWRMNAPILSLDAPHFHDDEEGDPEHNFIAAPEDDPTDRVYRETIQAAIHELLDGMPEREATVLRLRFGIGCATGERRTLEEVGTYLGITRERARQIERDALEHVRASSRASVLRTLLQTSDFC